MPPGKSMTQSLARCGRRADPDWQRVSHAVFSQLRTSDMFIMARYCQAGWDFQMGSGGSWINCFAETSGVRSVQRSCPVRPGEIRGTSGACLMLRKTRTQASRNILIDRNQV